MGWGACNIHCLREEGQVNPFHLPLTLPKSSIPTHDNRLAASLKPAVVCCLYWFFCPYLPSPGF